MIWKNGICWASCLALATAALCGCRCTCGPRGLPDDPLYVGRKPQVTKPGDEGPRTMAFVEPTMPAPPPRKAPSTQIAVRH